MSEKKKIIFFGFSVTRYGNPSYPIRLKQMLELEPESIYDIDFAALGGVSIECVPFIMSHLKILAPDKVIFEIGTSHYSTTKRDLIKTKEILTDIIFEVSEFCRDIDFLLLPRKDIDINCTIASGLYQLQSDFSFGIIDMRKLFDDNWDLYANDFVHPSPKGVDLIAEKLKDKLFGRSSLDFGVVNSISKFGELTFKNYASHYKFPLLRLFEFTNFSYSAVPLRVDESFDFIIPHDCCIFGIFYIMGPDTASLEIQFKGEKIDVITFDRFSYYYRIGYMHFSERKILRKNTWIKILSRDDRRGISLDKDTLLKIDGIINYPISFSCMRLDAA